MKIKFNSIHIENFMSLGHLELSLDDCGYTLVSGVNNNPADLAKSNGSGKSSIFDAIMWTLTGSTIRGNKDVVNIHGDDGALVILDFDVDNHSYKLTRSKNHSQHKTNLKIIVDGADKSGKGIRDSEQLLKEYIPDLTPSLVGSVIILGQGLPERFTNNSPSGRKEVLERLCKSDFMIQELKDRISARKDRLSTLIREVEDAALVQSTKLEVTRETLAQDKITLEKMIASSDFDEQISNTEEELSSVSAKREIVFVQLSENDCQCGHLSDALQSLLSTKTDSIETLNKESNDRLQPLREQIATTKANLQSAQRELTKLQNIKDVCPTCGQRLPGVAKPDTTQIEADINQLHVSLDGMQLSLSSAEAEELSRKTNLVNSYAEEESKLKTALARSQEVSNNYRAELAKLDSTIAYLEAKLEELAKSQSNYAATIVHLEDEISELTQSCESAEKSLLYKYKERDDYQLRLGVINKFNTIVSRDFRGYLLSSIIDFIDSKAKMYCHDIFETSLIEFKLDGNNISITYDGKEYESLSGGEKQKVDLIIQFSIRDMLCSYIGFSTNILALDEIFDNLDEVGCSKVINLISTKLTDISSIFIITHHGSELNIPCDNEITVVKGSDGVSYLQ